MVGINLVLVTRHRRFTISIEQDNSICNTNTIFCIEILSYFERITLGFPICEGGLIVCVENQ